MPVILVVDDSKMDQALIGQLLKDEPLDWIVDFVSSAEEALVRLQSLAVDVMITDIMMPGMDGLALLDIMRNRYAGVPVILTTGESNESLAAAALRGGAASYVPKSELTARLGETIKQVLQVGDSERNFDKLFEQVSEMHFRFSLDSDLAMAAPLVSLVQRMATRMKLFGGEGCRQLGVALDEALMNAVFHGNLELPREHLTQVRGQLRDGESADIIHQRRMESPYRDRHVFVDVALSPQQLEVRLRDEGRGFDHENVASLDSDQPNGSRGLVLIRNLMDEVEFNSNGNEIRMVKRREPEPVDEKPIPL